MANAGSAATSALSGAAAGSMIAPGWGTAIGAGIGLLGGLMTEDGSAERAAMSRDAVIQAENEQRYTAMLQALGLQRSVAGTEDSFGSTTSYDPYTNTWKAMLGREPEAAQRASYSANIQRGSVDVPQASYGNQVAAQREAGAAGNISGASNALASYRDQSGEALLGNLQEATSRANNESYRPLIADTLRTYARTGSAAGPVLAQLGRSSADSLSKQMAENSARAATTTSQINATNRSALGDTLKTFVGAGQVGPRNSPGQPNMDPMSAITQALSQRPQGSTLPAIYGASGGPARTNAMNNAMFGAADRSSDPNFAAGKLAMLGKQGGNVFDQFSGLVSSDGATGNSMIGAIKEFFSPSRSGLAAYPNGYQQGMP